MSPERDWEEEQEDDEIEATLEDAGEQEALFRGGDGELVDYRSRRDSEFLVLGDISPRELSFDLL